MPRTSHRSAIRFPLAVVALALGIGSPLPASAQPSSPCIGGTIAFAPGGEMDLGSTGLGHGRELVQSAPVGFTILRRCEDDSSPCHTNSDCGDAECVSTCDCDADHACDIAGPVAARRCVTDLKPCDSDADCAGSASCVHLFGPPQPVSSAGVPTCIVSYFEEPLTGTADLSTGELALSTAIRSRWMLGLNVDVPCPRCGAPDEDPRLGDTFTCEGGQSPGASCRVDGVTEAFGGVSYDCAPSLAANVTGPGLTIHLGELTTATATATADLPCGNIAFRSNPLNAPTNPGKCLDDQSACTSNADCRRCTGNDSIACDADDDCTGNGVCAEAPDQPISCGFWCHCGFCDGITTMPCLGDSQCPPGMECRAGTGFGTQGNIPQQRPNDCNEDQFRCDGPEPETCATTTNEACSGNPSRACATNQDCADFGDGACVAAARSCFASRITRSGSAGAPSSHCSLSAAPCSTNDDCDEGSGACVTGAMASDLAGLFCSGATASAAVNAVHGITGPGAISLPVLVQACRCDGEEPGCEAICACAFAEDGAACDDGDPCTANDTCSAGACAPGEKVCVPTTTLAEPATCGDWNGDDELTASDAQGVLQAAVGIHVCAPQVCDYDGNGSITSNDALGVLRASVELPSTPACPP